VVRVSDDAGSPSTSGLVQVIDYDLTMNFAVDNVVTTVTQTLETGAQSNCGAIGGSMAGMTTSWAPATLEGYFSKGNINCSGVCGIAGAPQQGDTPVDNMGDVMPVSNIEFATDFASFTADEFRLSSDNMADTFITWTGTETGRELVDTPACGCQ